MLDQADLAIDEHQLSREHQTKTGKAEQDAQVWEGVIEVPSAVASSTEYATYRRRWLGILALGLMNISTSWGWLSFSSISTATQTYFDLETASPVNWLSTVVLFAYPVASPIVWWSCNRFNIRISIGISACLMIVASWLRYAGTVKNIFGLVMFAQILTGFAQPFALSTPSFYTDLWFTSRTRVSANALATLCNPFGGAVAGLVSPAIVTDNQGTNMSLYVLVTAIFATAAGLLSILIPHTPPLPPCPSSNVAKLSARESLRLLPKSRAFVCEFIIFSICVGNFNAITTFINQIMEPYGYSQNDAGYAAAVLIVAGLVFAAVASPIIDRLHIFLHVIMVCVPIMFGCTVGFIYMCTYDQQLAGPFIALGVFGAAAFIALPVCLEWQQEQISPCDPAVACSILWIGGQALGGIFVIVGNALKNPVDQGVPKGNMHKSLIFFCCFQACTVIPLFFVRDKFDNARVEMDRDHWQRREDNEKE